MPRYDARRYTRWEVNLMDSDAEGDDEGDDEGDGDGERDVSRPR